MTRGIFIGLMASALGSGFAQQQHMCNDPAPDSTRCYCRTEEIIVEGTRCAGGGVSRSLSTTDDALCCAEGVDMTRRANFASEPTIRGMSGGQISVTIDGMKMVSACVDKMDPITAYVEVENLSRLEVNKGGANLSHAQTIGGSINLVTVKPDPHDPMFFQLETGYESAARLRFARGSGSASTGIVGFRGSASIKRAGDFLAGGDVVIPRSGYAKENYKFDVSAGLGETQTIRVSYIGDNARDIGYPALIMDTRKTETHMVSVEHEWRQVTPEIPSLRTRVYINRVRHWMDDYGRSLEEITSRPIMPSMNMPMYGQTRVLGVLHEARYADANQTVVLNAEVYNLRAFADMTMLSAHAGIPPMYLVNVGDATLTNAGLAGEYTRQVGDATVVSIAGRCDYSRRELLDQMARDALSIYWQGAGSRLSYLAASISASAELKASEDVSLRLTGSRSQRLPTHIENYGYFLYNPMDNSIYVGNPGLSPERSWQSNIAATWRSGPVSASGSVFYVGIDNYIAGLTIISGDLSNRQFPQAFRRFDNIGRARIYGAEVNGTVRQGEHVELQATIRAQDGYSLSLQEPLPLIPPLCGLLRLRLYSDDRWIEGAVRFAGRQSRVSRSILPEDPSAGHAVADFKAGLVLNQTIEIRGGIENIFNLLYHEHVSINNLPSPGRNVYLSVGLRL